MSVRLRPEAGLVALGPDLFRADTDEPWLAIDLPRVPAGRWVALRYRADRLADPVRPLLRMVQADGRIETEIMAGPVCGAATWVTRLAPGTVSLAISPVRAAGPFAFALDRFAVLGRVRLVAGALRRKPGLTLTSCLLRIRGKRVRARHFVKSIWASAPFSAYSDWLASRETPPLSAPSAGHEAEVTVLIDTRAGGDVARTRASLAAQIPPPTVLETGPDGASPGDPPGGWFGIVTAGDTLAPGALAVFMAAAARDPAARVLYCDEDRIAATGRRSDPRLKPDWSPRLQAATGYIGALALVRIDGPAGPNPLADALARPDVRVGHVRRILYHRAGAPPTRPVAALPRLAPSRWPAVSVVVPNRDRLELLGPCLAGLMTGTDYPDLEIVVVDNGSVERATLAHYAALRADPRVTILAWPGPFNFSALCNAGVAASRGEIVVLLNNDIEVIGPDWLRALVAEAVRPEVGAVGARLLYPDGRLQHGGVVIGLGGAAGHIHRGRPGTDAGWLGRLDVTHEVSAVTGACLAVARAKYDAVGGLDETLFPVSFNDIDFCLKLGAAGYQNLMVPAAVLYHRESASRGADRDGARQARAEREAAHFAGKWHRLMRDDPYFHPGLSLLRFDVSLG